jgi:hypothetical protein
VFQRGKKRLADRHSYDFAQMHDGSGITGMLHHGQVMGNFQAHLSYPWILSNALTYMIAHLYLKMTSLSLFLTIRLLILCMWININRATALFGMTRLI